MFSIFHFYIQFMAINAINKRTTFSIRWDGNYMGKKTELFHRNDSFFPSHFTVMFDTQSNQFTWQFSYTMSFHKNENLLVVHRSCGTFALFSCLCSKTDLNLTYDLRRSRINELKIVNDAQIRIQITKKFSSPTSIVFRLYFSMHESIIRKKIAKNQFEDDERWTTSKKKNNKKWYTLNHQLLNLEYPIYAERVDS